MSDIKRTTVKRTLLLMIQLFGQETEPHSMHDLIALQQWPTMPAPLSSSQPGEAWVWGDYVLTLQVFPKKIADALHQLTKTPQTAKSPIDYPFAVTTYYKKDRNPHGPSSRPILAVCLEKMNNAAAAALLRAQGINPSELGMDGDSPYVLGMFTASNRFNLGNYDGPDDVDSVRSCLFEIIAERLQPEGEPVMIGPIAAIHGHPNTGWPAQAQTKKGGCLGSIALAATIVAACLCFAILHTKTGPNKGAAGQREGRLLSYQGQP